MTDTSLKAIQIKPGIQKNQTDYDAEGSWIDCDHIRFRAGVPQKINGWVRETVEQSADTTKKIFTGISRALYAWTALDSKKFLASGSHSKLELMLDNRIYDITPVRATNTLEDAISTTDASPTVSIRHVNHNLVTGDYVYVSSQETAVGGITLSGNYEVTVVDADNFTVTASSNASGTVSLSGDTLSILYLLETGYADNGNITGWGGGSWGTEGASGQGWNRPRAGIGGVNLRQWSLDNWGEDLLACPRGGKIYHWDRTSDVSTRAVTLTNAPEENLFVMVSQPSRHVIAFGSEVYATGTHDPLIIRWASSESLTDWDASSTTNTAGEYRLPKGTTITGAVQTNQEIIVFTDSYVYSMTYVGGDDIFQFNPLGKCSGPISQSSVIDINGTVIWAAVDGFYTYSGSIKTLATTVDRHVFDVDGDGYINLAQKEKSFLTSIREFGEIMLVYPCHDCMENSRYLKLNYVENLSDVGTLQRSSMVDKGVFERPYGMSSSGVLYIHEQGKDDDAQPLQAFITSAYFDIEDGNELMYVDRIIPDLRLAENRACNITLKFKKYPHPTADVTTKGPYSFDNSKDQISVRGRGRQMSFSLISEATGSDFEIGKIRIGLQKDGKR